MMKQMIIPRGFGKSIFMHFVWLESLFLQGKLKKEEYIDMTALAWVILCGLSEEEALSVAEKQADMLGGIIQNGIK